MMSSIMIPAEMTLVSVALRTWKWAMHPNSTSKMPVATSQPQPLSGFTHSYASRLCGGEIF